MRTRRGEFDNGVAWDRVPAAPKNPELWTNPSVPPPSTEVVGIKFVDGMPGALEGSRKAAGRPEKAYEFAEAMRGMLGVADAQVNDFAKLSSNPDVYEADVFVYADPAMAGLASAKVRAAAGRAAERAGVRLVKVWTPRQDRNAPREPWALRDFYRDNPYKVVVWATEPAARQARVPGALEGSDRLARISEHVVESEENRRVRSWQL